MIKGRKLLKEFQKSTIPLLIGFLFFSIITLHAQSQDSIQTAFKKGRWLTGLSGTISTTSTKVQGVKTISNNFGINIESGKFIKNRLLFGAKFNANKRSSGGNLEETEETFFIGPFLNYYLMDSKSGSLFTSVSLGYVRYRQEAEFLQVSSTTREFAEGGGIGSILRLGYSYTMNRYIVFDLGMNLDIFRVNVNQESSTLVAPQSFKVSSSDVSFSFGFNVILDDFFF